jgi:hypothetical protein
MNVVSEYLRLVHGVCLSDADVVNRLSTGLAE